MELVLDAVGGWILAGAALAVGPLRGVDAVMLAAGLVLQLAADVIRTRGWFTILRVSFPDADRLRWRDVAAATFAGGGVNAVVPARGGDLLKLALLRRWLPNARPSTMVATLAPESLFEVMVGVGLFAWAIWRGFIPLESVLDGALPLLDRPLVAAAAAVLIAAALAGGWLLLRRRVRELSSHVAAGLEIIRRPRTFVLGVASWQALSRLVRVGSLCCMLAAFGLPSVPAVAVLVMSVDGGTRVRFAGATTALRAALLIYGIPRAGGAPVEAAAVVAYLLGIRLLGTLTALGLSAASLLALVGTASPRRAVAMARRALEPAPEVT